VRALSILLLLTFPIACSSEGAKAGLSPSSVPRSSVQVYVDCEHTAVRPKEILVACGDGSYVLTKVSYTAWSESIARGSATAIANDFTPDRATGKDHAYAVAFTLDKPIRTADGLLFSRASVRYLGANPYGNATDTFPLAP